MDDYEKDQIAKKMIHCLTGLKIQDAIDQLAYTKDFLLNRTYIDSLDSSALDEEYKKHKKEQSS